MKPENPGTPDRGDLPLKNRIRSFLLAVAGLVAIIYLAQYPIEFIPAFRTYSEVVDKNGFNPGALYYTDVHVTADSEKFVKRAIQRATSGVQGDKEPNKEPDKKQDEEPEKKPEKKPNKK